MPYMLGIGYHTMELRADLNNMLLCTAPARHPPTVQHSILAVLLLLSDCRSRPVLIVDPVSCDSTYVQNPLLGTLVDPS